MVFPKIVNTDPFSVEATERTHNTPQFRVKSKPKEMQQDRTRANSPRSTTVKEIIKILMRVTVSGALRDLRAEPAPDSQGGRVDAADSTEGRESDVGNGLTFGASTSAQVQKGLRVG